MPDLVWMRRRSAARRARPLTERECLILDRIGRDRTHKDIAAELGVSINTVADLAAQAYRKLGAHGAAAAVLTHRDAHAWCGTRIDFGPIVTHRRCGATSRVEFSSSGRHLSRIAAVGGARRCVGMCWGARVARGPAPAPHA